MKITPLAADSLGARSMATLVETPVRSAFPQSSVQDSEEREEDSRRPG